MKITGYGRFKALSFLHRTLMVCLITLALIIAGGTIYGVFFHDIPPRSDLNERVTAPREIGQAQTFTGIGQLRISTADPQPGMVILFVSFVYHPDDRAFSEELALRVRDLRDIVRDYIGSFTTAELQTQDENLIRAELLRRFNTLLRLGQIETLFFSDFMIFS